MAKDSDTLSRTVQLARRGSTFVRLETGPTRDRLDAAQVQDVLSTSVLVLTGLLNLGLGVKEMGRHAAKRRRD
jgi:hypothetical protein